MTSHYDTEWVVIKTRKCLFCPQTGLFQSQSSLTYQLPGNNPPQISLRLVQTIQYSEGCVGQAKNITNSKIKLAKNMIVYEARENNLRVASTNKISSMNCKLLTQDIQILGPER